MLIVMANNASEQQIDRVVKRIEELGFDARPIPGSNRTAIGIIGNQGYVDDGQFLTMDGVRQVIHVTRSYKLASREFHPEDTVVEIDGHRIGSAQFSIIAGPCSVESESQLLETASFLSERGVKLLRGGAYKPRTSPYSFQGLGEEGLKIMAKVAQQTGMRVITEAVDVISIDRVVEYSDVIQIGARNMQNYPLLIKAGRSGKPILLKRGLSATAEELLLSAEYILNEGNGNIILCERGVRTFDNHSRNTLDLSIIPVLKELTHLPVLVDPSHASGNRKRVIPLSRAALAVGADGIIVEIHPQPEKALSDGPQSLYFSDFDILISELDQIAQVMNKPLDISK
jgi:3-deoxy-7-phosphoheptulonate synthase